MSPEHRALAHACATACWKTCSPSMKRFPYRGNRRVGGAARSAKTMRSAATREFARFLNGLNLAQLVVRLAHTGMWDDIDDSLRCEWTHKSFRALFFSLRDYLTPMAEQQLGYVMVGCHAGPQTQNRLSGGPHRHQLAAYCLELWPRLQCQPRSLYPTLAWRRACNGFHTVGGGGGCGLRGMAGR
jgi:hypothetical protein